MKRVEAAQKKRFEDSRQLDKPKQATACFSTRSYLPFNPHLVEKAVLATRPKIADGKEPNDYSKAPTTTRMEKKLKSCLKKCTPDEYPKLPPEQQLAVTAENTIRNRERPQSSLAATREFIQGEETPKYKPPHLRQDDHEINVAPIPVDSPKASHTTDKEEDNALQTALKDDINHNDENPKNSKNAP